MDPRDPATGRADGRRAWPLRAYFAVLVGLFVLAAAAAALLVHDQLAIFVVGLVGTLLASLVIYDRVARPIERRRAEEQVGMLAAMIESSQDAIIGKSLDGTIESWNHGAERAYGYTAAEAIGRSIAFIIPPDRADELPRILEQAGRGVPIKDMETVRRHKSGKPIDVVLTISPIRTRGGKIVGSSTIARDIGGRTRAEHALRLSEESYRQLFERHPGPMWLWDPATLRLLAVNEAAVENYGYTAEEFLSMTILDLVVDGEREALREMVAAVGPGRVAAGVWRHRRKDGSVIDVQVSSSSLEFEGRAARLVLAQDITEQRQAEEQLRQSEKMDAIGSLAGGIAHDFNNILMVIRACGALLLRRIEDEELRADVMQIDNAAQRAAELTHQLLAFSRQQVLRPETTSLNLVVEETLVLLDRVLGEDIEIVCELDPQLESTVVDRTQLGQVIMNLAVNSRDAMSDGGLIKICTANVTLDEAFAAEHPGVTPGKYALLEVADSGEGMDEDTRLRVFDPFYTTKKAGTGLGLATVYGIVKQSGGHVALHSEPEVGTTFRIYFPRVSAPLGTLVSADNGTPGSLEGAETILVVEDEEEVLPLIADALRSYGYVVLEAASGPEAIDVAAQEQGSIDLLLSDVVMPGMNGRELSERLLLSRPTLKVLFTSGYPADTIIRHGIEHATTAYLEKPYLPDELARKVRDVLDGPGP
jgi:two-component system, cell cycle sensor histidine kinase and response regulator CckA